MNTSELFHKLDIDGPILALDIGSGTQDALLAVPNTAPENWPRFVELVEKFRCVHSFLFR